MPRYAFALSREEDGREAGIVHSESFDDALEAVCRRFPVKKGDRLEIGVAGFPPACYEHTGYARGVKGWRPSGLLAA
jgi:hypothetical protein